MSLLVSFARMIMLVHMAQSILILVLALTLEVAKRPDWRAWIGLSILVILDIVLALDWIVCRRLWRYAKLYTRDAPSFWIQFIHRGITWKELGRRKAFVQEHMEKIRGFAEKFPSLDVESALQSGGLLAAYDVLAKAENEAVSVARAAERTQERMRDIARRAECASCLEIAANLARNSTLDAAEVYVATCEGILLNAKATGADEAAIRRLIAAGESERAEVMVETARRTQERSKVLKRLAERVDKLRAEHRAACQELLHALEAGTYGTREYRMRLHALEKAIEEAEGK